MQGGLGADENIGLKDNVSEKGTTDAAIAEGVKIFTLANTKCPDSVLVFGGYRFVSLPQPTHASKKSRTHPSN